MREFFQRQEEDTLVSIEIDMNAYAYSKKYSWLFSIFIKFEADANNEESYEEFLETKESLIIALEHDNKAKFVGLRVIEGWSEFYFYADSSKDLDNIVSKMLKPSNYAYESNVVKDAKWDFHHKNLSPTDLELAHIQSEKIIFLLEEEGDDLSVVRPVEHYVSFITPTQKNRFINTLSIEGLTLKDEIQSDEFEHGLALVKNHALDSESVKTVVTQVYEAVKKEQGFYEGWSTILASEIAEDE
jgi:hypothetical protein